MLLFVPRHVAVGVWCEGCYGTYVRYKGKKYFYLETTYPGWELGEMPDELKERYTGFYVESLTNCFSYFWWLWDLYRKWFGG